MKIRFIYFLQWLFFKVNRKRFLLFISPAFCFGDGTYFYGSVGYSILEPIVGASIKLIQGTETKYTEITTSDGGFSFPPTIYSGIYTVQVSGTNIVTYAISYQIYPSYNAQSFYLPAPTEYTYVTVNVVDVNKQPLQGALVNITQNTLLYGSGSTNGSGALDIYGLQLDSTFTLAATLAGYQPASVTIEFNQPAQAFNLTLLQNPGSVSGIITNDLSAPIEDVQVDDLVNNFLIQSTSTNSLGQYSFPTASVGNHIIRFTKEGYQQNSLKVSVATDQSVTNRTVELVGNPGIVSGTIYSDANNTALQGAVVILVQNNNISQPFLTGTKGNYSFRNVPPGNISLIASKPNYQMQYGGVTLQPGQIQGLDFTLPADSTELSGTVSSGNIPITGAAITVMLGNILVANTLTTAEGHYSISGLIPGTYTVNAVKTDYQNSTEKITLNTGEVLDLVFDLAADPASLNGYVRDILTSDPISNATVTVFKDENSIETTSTNASGYYFFTHIPVADLKIRAMSPLYQDDSFQYDFEAGESVAHNFLLELGPNTLNLEVYDLITGYPLPGALITLFEDSSLFSSVIGTYLGISSFTGLSQGTYIYSAQLPGYISNQSEPFSFSGDDEVRVARIGLYSQDEPPRNLEGNILFNYYGAGVVDVIHNISWEASLSPEVVSYNVYGNGVLLGNVLSSETLEFNHHNQNKNEGTTYRVESVNSDGSVSSSVEVILR